MKPLKILALVDVAIFPKCGTKCVKFLSNTFLGSVGIRRENL
jgi:hypothetical protein